DDGQRNLLKRATRFPKSTNTNRRHVGAISMKAFGLKLAAAAVAIAVGSPAMATMAVNNNPGTMAPANADLVFNLIDIGQGIALAVDLGLTQATFNAATSYQFDLSSDVNFQSFATAAGTDLTVNTAGNVQYNVLSSTFVNSTTYNVWSTSRGAPS